MRGQFEVRRNRPGLLDRSRRPGEGMRAAYRFHRCGDRGRRPRVPGLPGCKGKDSDDHSQNDGVGALARFPPRWLGGSARGLQVATQPISIDVSGVTGGTNVLGSLICTILETVNNVVGLVNLLNQLLGILGGLTG